MHRRTVPGQGKTRMPAARYTDTMNVAGNQGHDQRWHRRQIATLAQQNRGSTNDRIGPVAQGRDRKRDSCTQPLRADRPSRLATDIVAGISQRHSHQWSDRLRTGDATQHPGQEHAGRRHIVSSENPHQRHHCGRIRNTQQFISTSISPIP